MTNSVDPDQLASSETTDLDLHCLQRQDISGFNRTGVNNVCVFVCVCVNFFLSDFSGTTEDFEIWYKHWL